MAFEVRVPRLGWSMESGVFLGWLKQDGEAVKLGDALYELEGEKATQEIEAVDAGILRIPADSPKPGSEIAVGTLLAYVVAEGESLVAAQPAEIESVAVKSQPDSLNESRSAAASPAVRRLARELDVSLNVISGSGPSGKIIAADVRSAASALPKNNSQPVATPVDVVSTANVSMAKASPRAKRVAKELQVDWRTLTGSGRGGRIRERDVRAAASGNGSSSVGHRQLTAANETRIPITSRRRTIARRMVESQQQTAAVTLTAKADATNLVSLREQFKVSGQTTVIPSYTDIIVKLVASALRLHPVMASRWEADHIVVPAADGLHIGLAIDTDDGLLVSVVTNAANRSLLDVAATTRLLVERAKAGRPVSSDIQQSVFTISNLGAFGVEAFTPIINLPETAILGLGEISRQAVVLADGQLAARHQITLSLTFDHRVIDGAPAARFLQTLRTALETPSAWLLGNA